MTDKWIGTKEQFDHLFNKAWDNVLTKGYILNERSLPTEQQILESWRNVQQRLKIEQTNRNE